MSAGLATRHAPSFRLVGAHFAAGLVGALLFGAGLVLAAPGIEGHFFQAHLIGLVHLCALGWLLPIAIGAMHQLVPVVFEVPVRSEKIAWVAFVLYVTGTAGLVGHMWFLATGRAFALSAIVLAISIWIYAANLLVTLVRTKVWGLTAGFVVSSLLWLLFAASMGLALSLHLHDPWLSTNHLQLLRVHAHAAGGGFFALLVMGIAHRLLEMFLLAYGAPTHTGKVALVATNLGLFLYVAGAWQMEDGLAIAGAAAIAVGVAAFLIQMALIYRRRMNRKPEAAWQLTLSSFVHLGIVTVLGVCLALADPPQPLRDRLVLAYGLLALPGFLGSVVVGQLYKILPFLVWLHRFSPLVGLKKVPSASEILPEAKRRWQAIAMQAGIAVLAAGVIAASSPLRLLGAAVFLLSALLATRNFARILWSRP